MSRDDEDKSHLFDIRTVERNIKKGLISRKEYEAHLKSLPDAGLKAALPEAASARDEDEDDDDEDGGDEAGARAGSGTSNGAS